MEEYISAAAQSFADPSHGGPHLWREYRRALSVDKRYEFASQIPKYTSVVPGETFASSPFLSEQQNCPKTNGRLEPQV